MKSSFALLVSVSLLLTACSQPPLVVGPSSAPIAVEDVVIYYVERPRCDFETIAHLQANGGYYSLESMLRKLRRQAAELGASGLYVVQTQQLAVKEYLGTAKAIRCLPARA